jgi:hypothetical protein
VLGVSTLECRTVILRSGKSSGEVVRQHVGLEAREQAACFSWRYMTPLHPDLQTALMMLQTARGDMATSERPILFSERGGGLSPATVRLWFHRLYTSLKMDGCSSHSGRRTFITRAARKVSQVGGVCGTCRSSPVIPAWP